MVSQKRHESVEYVLAERKFSGAPADIVSQLDDLIESLLGVRKWLLSQAPPKPQKRTTKRRGRRATVSTGVLAVLMLLLLSMAFLSAQTEPPTDNESPAAQAQPPEAASTQASSDPWRNVKFGATLEGYYDPTAISTR